jgi:hypothetical protein
MGGRLSADTKLVHVRRNAGPKSYAISRLALFLKAKTSPGF